jgi:putative spermidine/putrescine transport system permease protein
MRGRYGLLVAPAVALLLVAFAYPVGRLIAGSVTVPTWTLRNFELLIERPVYLQVLLNTATISGIVTLVCLGIGYPLAYTMAHASPRLRRLLIFAVLIPFWTSILVRTFAWMVLLQRNGLVNQVLIGLGLTDAPLALVYNRLGTIIGMVQILLPFMVFPLYAVMGRIEPVYERAAAVLGAGPVRSFLRIYLPLSMPGLFAGCTLVFIVALGYFITPALLGGASDLMIAQMIEQQIANFGNWGLAGALSAVLLAGTALVLAVARMVFGVRSLWRPA